MDLGTLIITDNNISAEINNRIALANRSYFGLVNILKVKNINRKYTVIIYKTLTLRLLMSYIYIYGAPILDVCRSHTTTQHSR